MDQDRAAQVWGEAYRKWYDKAVQTGNDFAGDKEAIIVISAYGQERYRAGVEAARFALLKRDKQTFSRKEINDSLKLLAEQEKK